MGESQEAKERFTSRVSDYVRFRPSYPAELLDLLKQHVAHGSAVADIGSGTGIFSKLLLEAGFTVLAVEPNAAMRRHAETALGNFPGFSSVQGEAERTHLRDCSVGAITVAQAFHWFATKAAVGEFSRILTPDGTVLLMWNDRKTDSDRFHRNYEDLLVRYGTDYARVNHRNITEGVIRELFVGWTCQAVVIENHQDLTFEALIGRLESSSYCPPKNHKAYAPLMSGVGILFEEEASGGSVRMKYDCIAYVLKRPPERP